MYTSQVKKTYLFNGDDDGLLWSTTLSHGWYKHCLVVFYIKQFSWFQGRDSFYKPWSTRTLFQVVFQPPQSPTPTPPPTPTFRAWYNPLPFSVCLPALPRQPRTRTTQGCVSGKKSLCVQPHPGKFEYACTMPTSLSGRYLRLHERSVVCWDTAVTLLISITSAIFPTHISKYIFRHHTFVYRVIKHTTTPWTSYQIRKIAGCACAGNPGKFSPPPTSKETAS